MRCHVSISELHYIKFSIPELELIMKSFYPANSYILLKTQLLTAKFCVEFIVSENIKKTEQDCWITLDDIIVNQPHILYSELYLENKLFQSTRSKM